MNFKLLMAIVATRFIIMQQESAQVAFEENCVRRDVLTVSGHEPIREERPQKGGCSKKQSSPSK